MSILPSSAARAQRRGEKRPAFPKPRGAAPIDAHGALCTWNFEIGGWVDSHGIPHVVVKNPKRRGEAAQCHNHLAAAVDSAEPSPSPTPPPPLETARMAAEPQSNVEVILSAKHRQRRHPGHGWEWDSEWCCYYNVGEAASLSDVEARIQADAERHVDRTNQAEVREWLEALISDLECELEPPSYSFYEVERLRTIVGNSRILLALSQAALRDAPVGSSAVHLAHLERECRNAAERLVESEHELERVELYTTL